MITIKQAIHELKQGHCIIYPTEAIYGLGADARQKEAVEQVRALKERPLDKPFLMICDRFEMIEPWVNIKKSDIAKITASEQLITWVVPASEKAPPYLCKHGKIGFRITSHSLCMRLCQELGSPIISTSANIGDQPYSKDQIEQSFPNIPMVAGQLGGQGAPSAIYDITNQRYLRR